MLLWASYHLFNYNHLEAGLSAKSDYLANKIGKLENHASEISRAIHFDKMNLLQVDGWLKKEKATYLIFNKDSICYWNNNKFSLNQSVSSFPIGNSLQHLPNGWGLISRRNFKSPDSTAYISLCVTPIYFEYEIENEYLQNHFDDEIDLPDFYFITHNANEEFTPLQIKGSEQKLYLGIDRSRVNDIVDFLAIFGFISGLLFIFLFVQTFFTISIYRLKQLSGLLPGLIYSSAVWTLFNHKEWLPAGVKGMLFFDPELFASFHLSTSLGSLIVKAIIIFWWSVQLFRFRFPDWNQNKTLHVFLSLISIAVCYIFLTELVLIANALVFDSNINFSFSNSYNFNIYGLAALSIVGMFLISFLFVINKIFDVFKFNLESPWKTTTIFLVAGFLAFPILRNQQTDLNPWLLFVFFFAVIWFLLLNQFKSIHKIKFGNVILLLIFFSVSSGSLLSVYSHKKEEQNRLSFAKKLSYQRDNVTEFLLQRNRDEVLHDKVMSKLVLNDSVSYSDLNERIAHLFFRNGFNNYDIKSFVFNSTDSVPLPDQLVKKFTEESKPIIADQLYFKTSEKGNLIYQSVYPFYENGKLKSNLVVQLSAKVYKAVNVYPELLLEQKNKLGNHYDNFSYSVYFNDQLVEQYGPLSFKSYYVSNLKPDSSVSFIEENGIEHLLFQLDNDVHIVVSSRHYPLSVFLSSNSYMFVVLLSFILFFLFLIFIKQRFSTGKSWSLFKDASFKSIIQTSLFAFIIISALFTSAAMGQYFIEQYNLLNRQKLVDKLKVAAEDVSVEIKLDSISVRDPIKLNNFFYESVNSYSEVQGEDLNFFDLHGNLLSSSQPLIFDRGLVSRKINPQVLENLSLNNKSSTVQNEKIGELEFLSGYMMLYDDKRNALAILNLPYFNTNHELKQQLGFFFIVVVNILVCLFILAGFLSPFISRQIIKRLNLISNKFKQVNLRSLNQPIVWHNKDELGLLVEEFNKLILKLEQSAERIAKSERESAWREMAKQIAHEIKNPLTPMKLSIQHLQKAVEEKRPGLDAMTKNVTTLLIEQIENLSHIATEFSNFSKMPEPEIADMNLMQLLNSAVQLFNTEHSDSILIKSFSTEVIIQADKKQLLQVMNNLLLNSLQAIPENRKPQIMVEVNKTSDSICISVSDNGTGIPEDAIENVFRPYFTTKTSGTGLGLAITKNMIEQMKGKIWFESKEGIGTTFFISFPRNNEMS